MKYCVIRTNGQTHKKELKLTFHLELVLKKFIL